MVTKITQTIHFFVFFFFFFFFFLKRARAKWRMCSDVDITTLRQSRVCGKKKGPTADSDECVCLCVHNPFGTETSGRSDTRPSLLLEKRDFILFCFPFSALPSSLHRTQHTSTRTADGCTLWKTREVAARGAVEMRGPRGLKLKKRRRLRQHKLFFTRPAHSTLASIPKNNKKQQKKTNTKIFYRSNFIRDCVKRPSPVSLNILLLHCQRQPQSSAAQ